MKGVRAIQGHWLPMGQPQAQLIWGSPYKIQGRINSGPYTYFLLLSLYDFSYPSLLYFLLIVLFLGYWYITSLKSLESHVACVYQFFHLHFRLVCFFYLCCCYFYSVLDSYQNYKCVSFVQFCFSVLLYLQSFFLFFVLHLS